MYAIVAGVTHILVASTPFTVSQADVWRMSITSNVLSWTQNGGAVASFTDTNNYITAGSPGFGLNNAVAIASTQTALWAAGANQAAAPAFVPGAGSFQGNKNITINGPVSSTIYYTTDGSTPTHASPSFATGGNVLLSSSKTLKAIASLANNVDSTVTTGAYTITGGGIGDESPGFDFTFRI